jgi:hypothetical protein
MVVMKLDVKESSENRRRRQLLPTPAVAKTLPHIHVMNQPRVCHNASHNRSDAGRAPTAVADQEKLDQIIIILTTQ